MLFLGNSLSRLRRATASQDITRWYSALRRRAVQLTIRPRRRVGRVQRTHRCGNGRRGIGHPDALIYPVCLVRPCGKRRCLWCARPVVEVEIHEIEVPFQFLEHLHNLWVIEPVHLHRNLGNRRQQLIGGCEQRIPFRALDVHLDDQTLTRVAVFPDLIFQGIEEMRTPITGPIADTFAVKHERAAVAGWPRGIKAIVLMHGHVVPARHLASPIIIPANAVRIGCIYRLNQILTHQVSAIVCAAEALKRAILQDDRLEFRKDRLTELACRGPARDIANGNCRRCDSDDGKHNADGMSSHEGTLYASHLINLNSRAIRAERPFLPRPLPPSRDARYD